MLVAIRAAQAVIGVRADGVEDGIPQAAWPYIDFDLFEASFFGGQAAAALTGNRCQ